MAFHIKVTISNIEPPIWRRLRVSGSITFEQLHQIIQASFGWLSYHLFMFQIGNTVIAEDDPDYPDDDLWGEGVQRLDPDTTPISLLFDQHDRCVYKYDFGDSWEHEIVVEKRLKENRKYSTPVCLAGARHRPPEDVGGVGGYANFLETIRDVKHPEREDNLRWAQKDTGGRLFDPEYFDLEKVNSRLEHVLEDTPEFANALLGEGPGLLGLLKIGWFGPVVKTHNQVFDWERLGRLVSMLDDGQPIAIKVGVVRQPSRRGDK